LGPEAEEHVPDEQEHPTGGVKRSPKGGGRPVAAALLALEAAGGSGPVGIS
jgi:hypothetical protein